MSTASSTGADEIDAVMLTKPTKNINLNGNVEANLRVSPQPPTETDCNSEDSSLSDSDRTLVESYSPYVPESSENGALNSHENGTNGRSAIRAYYFKCEEYTEPAITSDMEPVQVLKVLVDKSMIMGKLKEHLEPIVKVPQSHFKIVRHNDVECSRMSEQLNTFE